MAKINLKNYTSTVPAMTSVGRMEMSLVAAGATNTSREYENGICRGISFRMVINNSPIFFKVPAQVQACFDVLWEDVKKPRPETKKNIWAQAERTAWKIISDWVEIQLSMILLKQAEPLQVFLPYVFDPASNKTYYEQLKDKNFKALLGNG